MEQYIKKSALVAEIDSIENETSYEPFTDEVLGKRKVCKDIKYFINTLEVKEVDLEKEIRRYRMNNPIIGHREESLYDYMTNVAKHFFELGMSVSNKAQKGE